MSVVQVKIYRDWYDKAFTNMPPQTSGEKFKNEEDQSSTFFSYFSTEYKNKGYDNKPAAIPTTAMNENGIDPTIMLVTHLIKPIIEVQSRK